MSITGPGAKTTTFLSDGDGALVAKRVEGVLVAAYAAGGAYERDPSTGVTRSYYSVGGRAIAERVTPEVGGASTLHYLHKRRLGGTTRHFPSAGAWHDGRSG